MKAMPYISCQLYNYKVLGLKETLPMSFILGGKHWSTPNKKYNQNKPHGQNTIYNAIYTDYVMKLIFFARKITKTFGRDKDFYGYIYVHMNKHLDMPHVSS